MRRRKFLTQSSRAALGFGILSLAGCSHRTQLSAGSEDRERSARLISDLEEQLPKRMADANVPGLSIVLIENAKIHWRRCFGFRDNASKVPVDHDTIFEAGSMSKPVFAYAVMKLCEKRIMDLDTPLTHYTPERFLEGDPRLDLITARHVLSHTAGFQNWRSKNEALQIHFTPGEQWHYSGEGYYYLQSVVTRLTGHVNPNDCAKYERGLEVCATDIDAYMKANVLLPFGMNSSSYLWTGTLEKCVARPHDDKGTPLQKKKPKAPSVARYAAAGGLHSTPTEYARFLIEVIDRKPSDAYRLEKETVAEMIRPHIKTNDPWSSSWALGWQVHHKANGNIICHGGYNTGFHSFAAASPDRKSGFVIMTNADGAGVIIEKYIVGELINRI